MNSALWKDNLREIKDSIPRFLSIFAIIALGVSFFIGIRAAGPSMVETARNVYQGNNMPDGHILSTAGLNENDLEIIEEYDNMTLLQMQSVNAVVSPGEENAKVFTYNGDQETNFFKITEGRMVESDNEIVLDSKYLESLNQQMDSPIKIGDQIILDAGDNSGFTLEETEFEVVGFARTPLYIERITRTGTANVFAVVSDQAVSDDLYSEVYYWVDEARGYDAYSLEYNQVIDDTVASLESAYEGRPEIRARELSDEIDQSIIDGEKEIADGYQELEDARTALSEAQDELSNGQNSVIEGQLALDQGTLELEQGEAEFKDGIKQYHQGRMELADARSQLNYNEQVYEDGLAQYEEGLAAFNEGIASGEQQLIDAQSQLDQAAGEAQAGYAQLVEGQAALDAGYAQLEAGRQELLTQLGLATNNQIPPEAILAAIEDQIAVINRFLDSLEAANNGSNPELMAWIESLTIERDSLAQNLQELTSIVNELPEIEESQQTLGELGLTHEQVSNLNNLLGVEVSSSTPVSEIMSELDEQINDLQIQEEELINNSESTNYAEIGQKIEEISRLEAQIQELETQLGSLQAERQNYTQYDELITRRDELVAQYESNYAQINQLNQSISLLVAQLQSDELSDSERATIQLELDSQYAELNELTNANQVLELEINELNASINEVQRIDAEITSLEGQLTQQREALVTKQTELDQLLAEQGLEDIPIDTDLEEIQTQLRQLVEAVEMLQAGQATLDEQSALLAAGLDEYYAGLAQLEQAQSTINQGWTELNAQRASGQAQLDESYAALLEGRRALDEGQALLNSGLQEMVDGKKALDSTVTTLQDGREDLADGQREAFEGRVDLLDGMAQYNLNRHQFEIEEPDALAQLEEGESELEDARSAINDLGEPTYIVEDRGSSSAYQSLNSNAEQLDVISNIFPVFFFAIAILVTFTTIKRMASEQRNYMGTMKQLGYTNGSIISKFIIYAGLASILGIIAGLVIGYLVFPRVILNAYNMLYYFEEPEIKVLWDWNVIAALIALATALIPAIVTPLNMLRTQPANLLQPEPPKSGKKLWLERFPIIWNRLSFNAKMTVRNLLRYKGRNSMTLIGVAGCTMLIVTGFGISNTISSLVDVQFGEIQTFDGMVYLNEDIEESDGEAMSQALAAKEQVANYMPVLQETYNAQLDDGTTQPVTVTVPLGDLESFSDFVTIRERDEQASPNAIVQNGPFITERMAELLGLSSGDPFILEDEDYNEYRVEDYTIAENYVSHYLYVNPEQYQAIFNKEPQLNSYLVNYEDVSQQKQTEEAIMEYEDVLTTVDLNTIAQSVGDQMGSLDLITLVLIISAASLAFVVLYNLTNINVAERIRELSTIKVLGFYNYEVSMYIFNEVLVLTFLGGLLGLGLGTILNTYLLKTMQMVDTLFYPTISIGGYIASFIISFIFSAIVMLFMHRKLKGIDMVEALKGVE